jgi:hypothetical protein
MLAVDILLAVLITHLVMAVSVSSESDINMLTLDVLFVCIGIVLTRHHYHMVFSDFSLPRFILLAVVVHITHIIVLTRFFNWLPRGGIQKYITDLGSRSMFVESSVMIASVLLVWVIGGEPTYRVI